MLQAQANIKKINHARQADGEEHKISKEDDEPQLMGEARAAMKELFEMNTNPANTLSLQQRVAMFNTDQRVAMLNTDQRRVFDKVKAHFLHQKEHEANKCVCNLTPLQMFVSGVGGKLAVLPLSCPTVCTTAIIVGYKVIEATSSISFGL